MSSNDGTFYKNDEIISIPHIYFRKVLAEINNVTDIKIVLYIFWFLGHQEGNSKFITLSDFLNDSDFLAGIDLDSGEFEERIRKSLQSLVTGGILICYNPESDNYNNAVYFLTSPKNQAIVKSLKDGRISIQELVRVTVKLAVDKPTIYKLYEENIGPLTPLLADALRDAEQNYPYDRIVKAFQIAVERNVRNWRYIDAILKSGQEKGKDGSDRQDTKEDRKRYYKGKYADFVEH